MSLFVLFYGSLNIIHALSQLSPSLSLTNKQLEINLKEIITSLETKVRGYYNSTVNAKEIFN